MTDKPQSMPPAPGYRGLTAAQSVARSLLQASIAGSEDLEKFSAGLLAFAGAVFALTVSRLEALQTYLGPGWFSASFASLGASVLLGFVARMVAVRVRTDSMAQEKVYSQLEAVLPEFVEEGHFAPAKRSHVIQQGDDLFNKALPSFRRWRRARLLKRMATDPLWNDKRLMRDVCWQERLTWCQALLVFVSLLSLFASQALK
jgi:hypothetical protein